MNATCIKITELSFKKIAHFLKVLAHTSLTIINCPKKILTSSVGYKIDELYKLSYNSSHDYSTNNQKNMKMKTIISFGSVCASTKWTIFLKKTSVIEPQGRDSRKQILIFKKVMTCVILKTCFKFANIIVSSQFWKIVGLYNN